MNTYIALGTILSLVCFAGCSADADSPDESVVSELRGKIVKLAAGGATTFTLNAKTASDLTLTIDCAPPADPDAVGPVFQVSAPTLDVNSEPARAGYWSRTANMAVGQHTVSLKNIGEETTCTVKSAALAANATCRERTEFRSPNTNHTHFRVGQDTSTDWEPFPTSGNHWGAWAMWSHDYEKPIKRGYLLHNLEHGGLVFSYACSSPTESKGCREAHDTLVRFANSFGEARVLITPDPTQATMYGIRAWRWAYTSDCWDETAATMFARTHFNHGREDIDADPPIPFDPATTNVPCQDLMAAPDSCYK